jgi:hypothetical protein
LPALRVDCHGVMVPIRRPGYQEVAVATGTVHHRRGNCLGMVYLGQMPETLSDDLTALDCLERAAASSSSWRCYFRGYGRCFHLNLVHFLCH